MDAGKSRQVWVTEQDRVSLLPWGDTRELVSNNGSSPLASGGFSPHPVAGLTGLSGQAPPLRCPQQSGPGGHTGLRGRRLALSGFRPLGGRPLLGGNGPVNAAASWLNKQAPAFSFTKLNVQVSVLPS